MKIVEESLDGVLMLEPTVYTDERGSFYEAFNHRTFQELSGYDGHFLQENHSTSIGRVLRGIHYQLPNPQGKLVRCIEGAIWDVAVDLRRASPTFSQWRGYELTEDNKYQLWIPEGFGHGFVVMSERAQVIYQTTELWDPNADRTIRWNDPELGIDWPTDGFPVLSDKDSMAPRLDEAPLFD